MLAWYDNADAEWRTSQISNRTIDGYSIRSADGALDPAGRASLQDLRL